MAQSAARACGVDVTKHKLRVFAVSAALFSFAIFSIAQNPSTSLRGTVSDSSGAVIQGATVTAGAVLVTTDSVDREEALQATNVSAPTMPSAIHDRVMDEVMLGADRVAETGGSPTQQLTALGDELLDIINRYTETCVKHL